MSTATAKRTGGSAQLGVWSSPITAGTPYQATTDGFVVFSAHFTASSLSDITIKTDSAATPTTVRAIGRLGTTGGSYLTLTCPVKKNDYVLCEYNAAFAAVDAIYWIPLS